MSSYIIIIPPWDVLVSKFGLAEDMDDAIASDDPKLSYAWSPIEDTKHINENRELTIYPPDGKEETHYHYKTKDTVANISLPMSFVQFCVDYQEKPIYGTSKTLGGS